MSRGKAGALRAGSRAAVQATVRATVRVARRPAAIPATIAGKPVYRRVLLKLSGEALMGRQPFGIDSKVVETIADEVTEVHRMGVDICIVVGGGNIFRGVQQEKGGMDRVTADHMGMLATVINGLALQDALEHRSVHTRCITAIEMREIAEPYIRRRAVRHLEKQRVLIFAAGTGNPYFTTDTAAALRAMEIGADVILKATRVDGVYTADPFKHKDATKFETLTYLQVLEKGLKVMDATAISLCMDHSLPIVVFNITRKGNIRRVVEGKPIGSIVRN